MSELQTQTPPLADERAPAAEPGWPATKTLWTAWLLPAATARHTAQLPLWRAWCAHFVAFVLAFLLFEFFVCWDWRQSAGGAFHGLIDLLGDLINEYTTHPIQAAAATATVIISIELACLALAGILGAWGARDERLRSCYAHALRQIWLHTAHALPAILLIGLTVVVPDNWRKDWHRTHPFPRFDPPYPTPPPAPSPPPPGVSRTSTAWKDYQAATRQYRKQSDALYAECNRQYLIVRHNHMSTQPWHIRYADAFGSSVAILVFTWVIWAALRGIATRADVRIVQRPPMCEACGYNLTGTPADGRCPECGIPAMESLRPGAQTGTQWERRRQTGRLRAWWRCLIDPIRRPRWFGHHVPVNPAGASWKTLLTMNLTCMCVLAAAAAVWCPALAFGWCETELNPVFAAQTAGLMGFFAALFGLFWTTATAGLVGTADRILYKRNLTPAALQNAAYLSGYLVLASITSIALGVAMILVNNEHLFDELFSSLLWMPRALRGMPGAAVGWSIMLIWLLIVLLLYLVLLLRATSSARYANR